jgi:hypothetical protein
MHNAQRKWTDNAFIYPSFSSSNIVETPLKTIKYYSDTQTHLQVQTAAEDI